MKDKVKVIKRDTIADLTQRGIVPKRKQLLDRRATLIKEVRKIERELALA